MTELVSSKFGRQGLQYSLETAHKARYSLCVGTEDVRYRALGTAMEIANLPDNHLPSELREERREILELANRYDHPRTLRKKTGRKLAERIYELCRAIESRYAEG